MTGSLKTLLELFLHQWTDFARRAAFITRQSSLGGRCFASPPLLKPPGLFRKLFSEEKGVQNAPWDPRVVETDQVYSDAMRKMNQENIDFLIADKHYLSKSTIQKSGKSTTITINNHVFKAIVLPVTYIIPQSSFKKSLNSPNREGSCFIG